ncbi:hypothetical protein LCGC14_0297980 [marine sediment metagenome]|uniref:Uncharacterized protein n=1 Tax=marine sediment metagenome TaxID=412755 RepID=A0A0F9TW53_9ZZZZ
MDEVITCKCGNQAWVIGEMGARCSRCNYWIPCTDGFYQECREQMEQDPRLTRKRQGSHNEKAKDGAEENAIQK